MHFNSSSLDLLRIRIDAALLPIARKFGITLQTGNISYLDTRFTIKLEGAQIGAKTKEQDLYDRNFNLMKLPARDSEFEREGCLYIVRGLKSRGKNRVLIERKQDNKVFVCPLSFIPRTTPNPVLPLAEFIKAVNDLDKAECDGINAGKPLFWAEHIPLPEVILKDYHAKGLTPEETILSIRQEAEAELRAEAAAS